MSEGSFFIKTNNDGCFQLKQRLHLPLFEAFKLIFETNRKISIENGLYCQFSVSSKADIQKVLNFFSFSGLPLQLSLPFRDNVSTRFVTSRIPSHIEFYITMSKSVKSA